MNQLCHPPRTPTMPRFAGLRRKCVFVAAAIAAGFALPVACFAQQQSELVVKAAYVFNLTKYVEWPVANDRIVIGVVGGGPMTEPLLRLSGKVSDSRTIVVLNQPNDVELKRCDLVYVALSSGRKTEELLAKLSGQSVLTVGDAGSFSRQGGMVTLLTVGDRIEIQVNLAACHQANLKISSKLLSLAKVVVTEGGTG